MPKISIIMPLYNSVEFLKEAIDSIINQTYTDWELIIINEFGSNDGSAEIVNEYTKKDSRIILLQNTKRLGISASMNRGIEKAKGDYIARMDADDISLPQRLEKQLKFLENNTEIVMCGVKAEIFGSNSFEWFLETSSQQLDTNILFYSPSIHPTIMIRKSFLEEYNIRYNENYKASEDYDLFSKICNHGKIANLNEVLFRYRIMENNATFKNNDIGLVIYNEIMARQFSNLDIKFNDEELKLLSPHYSVKNMKGESVLKALEKLSLLLQKIFIANEKKKIYDRKYLWRTLHKRFEETCQSTEWFCKSFNREKVNEIYSHSIFSKKDFYKPSKDIEVTTEPTVSVLIPTYNSENYIMGTIWSVLEQTFQDFEILVVNEHGSIDDTVFITTIFGDERIKVLQNNKKLGLADSLNRGINEARGIYIARMDADDLCHKDRLKLQVDFLENNSDYGICGSWQHHFGINTEWIHKCSTDYDDIQAELIFNCDLCHSTLMLRKEFFIDNNLYYDSQYSAEDYELWTRAIKCFKIANLPLVLGEYRVGESNITAKKMDALSLESGMLAARNIEYYFGFKIDSQMQRLQSGWRNEFNKLTPNDRKKALRKEKDILIKMWKSNQKSQILNNYSLLKTINKRWRFVTNTWDEDGIVSEIDELFRNFDYNHFNFRKIKTKVFTKLKCYSIKNIIKRALKKPYYALKRRTVDYLAKNIWDVDGHLYDYYAKLEQQTYDLDGHLYDYYDEMKNSLNEKNHLINETLLLMNNQIIELTNENKHLINLLNKHDDKLEILDNKLMNIANMQAKETEEVITNIIESSILNAINNINQTTDSRIWNAEKNIIQTIDTRIWNAEKNINQTTDSRIWSAEKNINQTADSRIWNAEKNIIQTADSRIWNAEKNIIQTIDTRIWSAEKNINQFADSRIWKSENVINDYVTEMHKHIDFTYRDLMVVINKENSFIPKTNLKLETNFPIAYESNDHLYPHGTIRDNTRYPRFIHKCEANYGMNLSFLDLGCSGGGMVLEALLKGHEAFGLEGSDVSKIEQRAEWRLIPNNLETCDISESFKIYDENGSVYKFDVITAWEVLEHIEEKKLAQLFENIKDHLKSNGRFVASIANYDDIDPVTGVNWHVTTHNFDWWKDMIESFGFELCNDEFDYADLARGGYNPPLCYQKNYDDINTETSFYVVAKIKEL